MDWSNIVRHAKIIPRYDLDKLRARNIASCQRPYQIIAPPQPVLVISRHISEEPGGYRHHVWIAIIDIRGIIIGLHVIWSIWPGGQTEKTIGHTASQTGCHLCSHRGPVRKKKQPIQFLMLVQSFALPGPSKVLTGGLSLCWK